MLLKAKLKFDTNWSLLEEKLERLNHNHPPLDLWEMKSKKKLTKK